MNNLKNSTLLVCCMLTACATQKHYTEVQKQKNTPKEQLEQQEQHHGKAQDISSWKIRGALAAKNKNKGWSAAMNWVQNGPSNYQIRLMGPLGSGAVLIDKKGNTITFQDGAKNIKSQNADDLLLKQTGIKLPVANLYYWVRGLAAPGPVTSEHRDNSHHLSQLQQDGYTITFANYSLVKGVDLPKAIRLEGRGLMIKVTIQNWTV